MSGPGAVRGKVRIYISGPMSGREYCNFASFDAAAARIDKSEDTPVNPAAIVRAMGYDGGPELYDRDRNFFYKTIMNILSQVMQSCQQIYMLDGWQNSKGAKAELALAEHFGLVVLYESDDRRRR